VDVWQWMPFVFLVLFAGLQAVPLDVVEAAAVDGAGGWARFREIDLPYLRPLLLLVVTFRVTDALRVFDHVQVLTMGGPGAATEFLSLYLYKIAFKFSNLNYASALALSVVIVVSIVFAVLLRNSLGACLATVVLALILALMIAYPLTRLGVPAWFRRGLLSWLLSLRFLPSMVVVIPIFATVRTVGLYDRLTALVLIYTAFSLPFAVWMLKGFLAEVPQEVEEA